MKTKLKLAFSAMLIALLSVSGWQIYAALQYTRTVPNHAGVKSAWGIALWRMDGGYQNPVEQITFISWPDLDPGTQFSTNQLFGTCLKLKNTGNAIVYVAWEQDPSTPLPTGVSLNARYDNGGGFTDLPPNQFSIMINPGQYSGHPSDPNIGRIEFSLMIDLYATPGPFTFNILLKAADSTGG